MWLFKLYNGRNTIFYDFLIMNMNHKDFLYWYLPKDVTQMRLEASGFVSNSKTDGLQLKAYVPKGRLLIPGQYYSYIPSDIHKYLNSFLALCEEDICARQNIIYLLLWNLAEASMLVIVNLSASGNSISLLLRVDRVTR